MKQNMLQQAAKYIKKYRGKKRWQKIVTCLAAIVVFCTTYALILPAITLEKPKCGIPEHTHSEDCYAQETSGSQTAASEFPTESAETDESELICTLQEHTHNDECYSDSAADVETAEIWERTLDDVSLTGDWTVDVISIAKTQLGYTESNKNYIMTEDGRMKGYTRYGEWYGDRYGDWSAMFASFCLHYANVEGMPLASDCQDWIQAMSQKKYDLYRNADTYTPEAGDVIFFDWDGDKHADHAGLVAELIPETKDRPAQIKTIEGDSDDRVQFMTYEMADEQILGYGMLPEQSEEASEEPPEEASIEQPKEASEESEEQPQEVSKEQPQEATSEQSEEVLEELTYAVVDYTVQVKYGSDAKLPEGVSLVVSEIPAESEEYQKYYEQSVQAMGIKEISETVVLARFFDIRFQMDGQKLEPAAPVSVTITYDEAVDTGEDTNCQAIHFTEKGLELLEVETENLDDNTTSFTHTQESFSVVGDVAAVTTIQNSTDIGADTLKVDYYVCIDGKWTVVGSTRTGWYGDYTATGWTDENRDYITVAQAESILGKYGFSASDDNPARKVAYQQKSGDTKIYSDTNSVAKDGNNIIPLARNKTYVGYNLYYLPANTATFKSKTSPEDLDKVNNGFYTVSVYDPNHLAYAESETLPEVQTVYNGGSATVTVKALSENSDATWQCVGADWSKVAEGTKNGDGTSTFQLTNITQQLRITPVVNNLGTSSPHTVHYYVYLDNKWTDIGNTTTIYKQPDRGRYFVTSAQVESVLYPYGFRTGTYSYKEDEGNRLAYQLGAANFQGTFYTDNNSSQLADGSWAIGLGYEDNDYSVYYLPANTESFINRTPEGFASSEAMNGNRFWSVTVHDKGQLIYDSAQLEAMTQYVLDSGDATVTVQNADGVIWSYVGKDGQPLDVETTQDDGNTVFRIKNISQPVEIVATKANPSFTVQYYGNIPRFAKSGDNPLKVIDTSGKALPTNGGSMATRSLYLEGTGQNTSQNAGNATQLYRVKTNVELTKLYTEQKCYYESSPGLEYFNKLKDNGSYNLKEIWVLKDGKSADSTNRDDWDIYRYSEGTAFTNEAGLAVDDTILINDGSIIRLVSDSSTDAYHNGTTFYDYNISSGQNADGRWRTGITGINIESNYGTSLNGQRNWRSGADVFAFGNANCGTGMSGYLFDGSTLNKHSSKNSNYGGATFGLANSLNSDGTIRYNDWIVAPKLFNDGDANGKQTYAGSSLTFDRVGDTYTLSEATLKNSNGQSNTLTGLQYFFNPSPTSGTTHTHIFTNNFWPMDPAAGRTDALWGKYETPGSFKGFVESNNYNWGSLAADFPSSDDGNAHNWFFGMNFSLGFSLTADYEGPLEYYFFGDDDLWVFLDGKLICDIGGVHSSIGEYVNLRDYLPVGSSGQHTLSFFYTERGASGSTCYMSFTLPSVSSATTAQDTGSLQIAKKLETIDNIDYSEEEYKFQVELLTEENGNALNQTFSYSRSDGTYGTVRSGGTVSLKADQTVTISGIPTGTFYRVTELTKEGYKVTVNDNEGYIASGKIETGIIKSASFVNTPYYELPETGGTGTGQYTIGGLLLMAGAGFFLLYGYYKRRKEESASS